MSEDGEKETKPKRWWQWFLIYPTLLIALLTAGPQWFDSISGFIDGFTDEQSDTELVRFMKRNDKCVRTPIESTVLSPGNSEIWAVICSDTGDIFVQITTPGGETFYSGVFVDELDIRKDRGEGVFITSIDGQDAGANDVQVAVAAAKGQPLRSAYTGDPVQTTGAAQTQTAAQSTGTDTPPPSFLLSQATVVVCQKFGSDGRIVRRLRQGRQCFKEVINGQTGRVEMKEPVSCDLPCP